MRVSWIGQLLGLIGALNIIKVVRYGGKITLMFDVAGKYKITELLKVFILMILIAHWNGCLQYLLSYISQYPDFDKNSWIVIDGLQFPNVTVTRKYTRSLFRALSHMLAVGYGQSPPHTTLETWIVMISMLGGITYYATFLGYMSKFVASTDYSGKKFDEIVAELKEFMRFHRVPKKIQHRVLEFYDHKFRRKFFDEDKILKNSTLSPPLKQLISMHNCRHLVDKVSFFHLASKEFIYLIVSRLEFQVYFPGEHIVYAGQKSNGMHFIAHGRVVVKIPKGAVIEILMEGSYFGEISLLFGEYEPCDVIAADTCDIYNLTPVGFEEVLEVYPDVKESLTLLANRARLSGRISQKVKELKVSMPVNPKVESVKKGIK